MKYSNLYELGYGASTESQANALSGCRSSEYWNATNMGMQYAGFAALGNALAMQPKTKLDRARERFGRPFKDWTPRAKPVLTEWLEARQAEKAK